MTRVLQGTELLSKDVPENLAVAFLNNAACICSTFRHGGVFGAELLGTLAKN